MVTTPTPDIRSIDELEPYALEPYLGARGTLPDLPGKAPSPRRGVLVPTLAISGACLAALVLASWRQRGSPWAGLNAVASGLGLVGDRPPARFDLPLALVGLGVVTAGSFAIALSQRKLAEGIGKSPITVGLMVGLGTFAVDRLVMGRDFVPALKRTLGGGGAVLNHAAMGLAAALTTRR
jgi:hypothetical protein